MSCVVRLGLGKPKGNANRELAPHIAEGRGKEREKVTASRTAKVLDGLRGLCNLNSGQSHMKFPPKSVQEKK